MEKITEGRTRQQFTPNMVQRHRLDTIFEMKSKHGLSKAAMVQCNHTVPVQTHIEREPLGPDRTETEVEFLTIEGGSIVMYIGPVFDHWTGHMFLEFVYGDRVVHYDYWKQHQADDTAFATTFQKVSDPTGHYGVM